MTLTIRAFGPLAATRDGATLDLGGPRQRAVLGLLVAAGRQVVSTDRFVEDLWAGEPPPRALGSLQSYVSRLRAVLEPQRAPREPARVLVSASPGYLLDLPDDAVDTWAFSAAVRAARAAAEPAAALAAADTAAALWSGPPFAAYADQEWAALEATRLDRLRAELVELRGAAALGLARPADVVAELEDQVRRHPLRERTVVLLATALYRLGRQGDALAALSGLRERLVEELGLDPGPEVHRVEQDILRHDPGLAAPAAAVPAVALSGRASASAAVPQPAPRPAADDVLLGREPELERLRAAAAATTGPRVLWVVGEPGVGKSALVERFADECVATWRTAAGRCPDVDGAPAGWAWTEVLAALSGEEPDPDAGPTPFRLARTLAAAVADRPHPALLLLEDVHRADGETLQVLRHLVTAVEHPVLVVATYRPEEVGTDLLLTVAAVAAHTADRLVLGGLPDAEAAELLRRHCGAPLPPETWTLLVRRASGNPLFLRQVARLAASEGPAIAATGVPSEIREILARRLDRLPGPTVDLLSRAAVLGDDIDLDLLVACEAERDLLTEDEVLDALDAGVVAGLLRTDRPGSVVFGHALVRDALHERLPPIRRQRLHATAWAVLERLAPDRTAAVARHAAAALEPRSAARAVPLLERAAAEMLAAGAPLDGVRHARAALEAHDLAQTAPRERLGTHRLLVRALASSGDLAGAHAARRVSVDLAARHGTAAETRAALVWESATAWTIREAQAVDGAMVERLRVACDVQRSEVDHGTHDPAADALLVGLLATLALETEASDLVTTAEQAAAEAVTRARALGDAEARCRALNAAYLVAYPPRASGLLREVAAELLEASRDAGLLAYEAVAHAALFGAHAGDGDLPGAEEHVAAALRCATAGQLPLLLAVSRLFEGARLLLRGELDAAAALYDAVSAQLAASGDPNGAAMGVVLRFAVAHARGDTSGCLDELGALGASGSLNIGDYRVLALLDAGREEEARAAWTPERLPRHDYFWLFNAALRGEVAARLRSDDEARRVERELRPWAGRFAGLVSGATTLGPVDHVLGLLAAHRGDADAARAHFAAAEALADGTGSRPWSERARHAATRL